MSVKIKVKQVDGRTFVAPCCHKCTRAIKSGGGGYGG